MLEEATVVNKAEIGPWTARRPGAQRVRTPRTHGIPRGSLRWSRPLRPWDRSRSTDFGIGLDAALPRSSCALYTLSHGHYSPVMASQFDDSDFIDPDFQHSDSPHSPSAGPQRGRVAFRPPSRQELDTRVGEAQHKIAELKRAQEELERERAALEEARRRRVEFQSGREEMLQSVTHGITLLEQAEFTARRDAEQMAKTLAGLREVLGGVQAIREETWTQETWNMELSKALASIENARMEYNRARLNWSVLNGEAAEAHTTARPSGLSNAWEGRPFLELCKLGLAMTWPVAAVGLVGLILFLCLRHR